MAEKLGAILLECGFPAASMINQSLMPDRLAGRFAAGKRGSTLGQRIRVYTVMKQYMESSYLKCFPSRPIELIDYLLQRAAQPCGPSVPTSILTMVNFMEEVGGRDVNARVGGNSMVVTVCKDLKLDLVSGRPVQKKKAKQLMVFMQCNYEIKNL